jgi:Na+/H+-dicarboxylate symporter
MKIFIGLGLGIVFGLVLGERMNVLSPIGDIFLRLMKMVIVPVVFFSLAGGTASLSDALKLRRIGIKTIVMFLVTSALAGAVGLCLVNLIRPGANFPLTIPEGTMVGEAIPNIVNMAVNAVPTNIVDALANADMLQIICFAIFLGCALLVGGEKAEPVVRVLNICAQAMYKITSWVMELCPYAIFCIMAGVTGTMGGMVLLPMAKFLFVMYLSVFLYILIFYPIILKGVARVSPIIFLKKAFQAWIVAFSLCSSSATLPVTLKVAKDDLGVPQETASFVCPLGATANMNGSCIYFAIVTVFVAQIYSIPFSFPQQVSLLLTAVLMSVGCAAIPNAALVLSVGLLSGMGVPSEPLLIVTGMYRLIDQAETSTNVLGDLMSAVTISATEKELDRNVFDFEGMFAGKTGSTLS